MIEWCSSFQLVHEKEYNNKDSWRPSVYLETQIQAHTDGPKTNAQPGPCSGVLAGSPSWRKRRTLVWWFIPSRQSNFHGSLPTTTNQLVPSRKTDANCIRCKAFLFTAASNAMAALILNIVRFRIPVHGKVRNCFLRSNLLLKLRD
jgi:hypothetical protein